MADLIAPDTGVRKLFGGAMETRVPARFLDLSPFRDVPDNLEVLADGGRDESLVVELLERKADVADADAATWFFHDLCEEASASSTNLLQTFPLPPESVPYLDPAIFKASAVGQMVVSKAREGPQAGNLVRCYLAVLRLTSVDTDLLIVAYEPLVVSASSSSSSVLGEGPVANPPTDPHFVPLPEVFRELLASLKIVDWGLFGS